MAEAHITITVEEIAGDDFEKTITEALERINGIDHVIVNRENKKIFIEYDDEKISDRLIKETIEDEGYIVK